ncbi:ATP-binding protein [Flavobacterium faecale]|uniref:ATP-binding protein n=1 Tax=Flavobacterium faecale TaxID=1355330 RepID=UPI003AACCBB5
MIKDDKQRVIGKLTSINSDKFTVELLNQSINFAINGFEDIYQYAQINGYVILPYQDFYIVAEIFGVRERDSDIKWQGEKEQILNKSNSVKYLDINPIGTIEKRKFKYGVSIFPTLYTDVLYIKKEELDIIFEYNDDISPIEDTDNSTALKLLEIGTSTIFPDYKVKVNINDFFGAHSAILGNTGSGKSCTISSMIQTLFNKDNYSAVGASFIFFDVNGEYHKAFSQLKNEDIDVKYFSINEKKNHESFEYKKKITKNIEYGDFKLPHWFLNIDEWALLLQASERTQLPILRSALGFSQNMDDMTRNHIYASNILYVYENWESAVSKRQRIISLIDKAKFTDIDVAGYNAMYGNMTAENEAKFKTSVKKYINFDTFNAPKYSNDLFEFSKFGDNIDEAILYEEFHGNKQIRDYCSSLITRYKSLKDREEFNFLSQNNVDFNKDLFLDDLLGVEGNKKKTQVTLIDLNSVEDEVVEVISCVITRMIFERLKNIPERNSFPINLVLEEAHRYISEHKSSNFGEANKIFERVAKEGRKYGLFLMVSSQRPSELSKTVLSQCSNFIIHRIQNPDDLNHIRQMTPHISSNILYRLPSIPTQHALVFGSSVQIPALFKVNNANPLPNSANSDIVKHWFIPKNVFAE